MDNRHRVLSIQSHVVHGYVGNKAAVFPLQLLGFDVDIVNSVHFSNHTGYPNGFEGDVLDGDQLKTILEGLKRNGLLENVGHVLTGYIGKETFLRGVIDVLQTLRNLSTEGKRVRYVCDPVLGDSGKFYVPQSLVAIYRDEVIPLADVVTPNQFEVEQLTGISVCNMEAAKRACRILHDMGPELVVITSLVFKDEGDLVKGDKTITILASSRVKSETGGYDDELWSIDSPILPGRFTGTGDLCAALLLGWTAREPNNLPLVMQKVISTMYSVIKTTWEQSKSLNEKNNELRLIQSKKAIEEPPSLFEAQRIV